MTCASNVCRSSLRPLRTHWANREVVVVDAELRTPSRRTTGTSWSRPAWRARVETGAGPGAVEDLDLEAGEQPQALRVAFESAARLRGQVEGGLAVVAERRVPEVVRQTRGLDEGPVGTQAAPSSRPIWAHSRNASGGCAGSRWRTPHGPGSWPPADAGPDECSTRARSRWNAVARRAWRPQRRAARGRGTNRGRAIASTLAAAGDSGRRAAALQAQVVEQSPGLAGDVARQHPQRLRRTRLRR